MSLFKFTAQVGTQEAFSIRARALDENFERLQPLPNGTYGIDQTPQGWSLRIFPSYPTQETSAAYYLTLSGGSLRWTTAEDASEETKPTAESPITAPGAVDGGAISPDAPITTPGAVNGSAISAGTLPPLALAPGANGSLLVTANNAAQWSGAPPSGTADWRQVERCDGQRMYVWGTEWAAPA